ncbi:MAG TPA: helix-turn-helix domain-containing protein [Planctomycetota bacterium]|nr:helix-turn-helix domain-containing protein [Planctomycetota bacterium]
MDDRYGEVEEAIGCFERWSGLAVTVHDLVGALGPHLAPTRQWHDTAPCQAVKHSPHAGKCMAWDAGRVRSEIADLPRGRIQVCHAGLVELAVPVRRGGRLELVLFAGQRSAGAGLRAARDDQPATPLPSGSPRPPPIDQRDAAHALEGLRQLGARLRLCLDAMLGEVDGALPAPSDRRHAIHGFIRAEHHRAIGLADLARHLRLSPHRAAHVVRALCGRTFVDLLTEARLRTACAMLIHTELIVADVAGRSGFGDVDHFHRVFRRRLRTTPAAYRRRPPVDEA